MKSIDNLVKDIYSLFDPIKETNLDEKEVDKHLDLFADIIDQTNNGLPLKILIFY